MARGFSVHGWKSAPLRKLDKTVFPSGAYPKGFQLGVCATENNNLVSYVGRPPKQLGLEYLAAKDVTVLLGPAGGI